MSGMAPPGPPATTPIPVPCEDRPSRHQSRVSSASWSSSGSAHYPDARSVGILGGLARRTLGIILLLVTVVLWTASSFLASVRAASPDSTWGVELMSTVKTIFADNTYSKPYFVTYINTSFFAVSLIPIVIKALYDRQRSDLPLKALLSWASVPTSYVRVAGEDGDLSPKLDNQDESLRQSSRSSSCHLPLSQSQGSLPVLEVTRNTPRVAAMSLLETAKLSLEFCILWVRRYHLELRSFR